MDERKYSLVLSILGIGLDNALADSVEKTATTNNKKSALEVAKEQYEAAKDSGDSDLIKAAKEYWKQCLKAPR